MRVALPLLLALAAATCGCASRPQQTTVDGSSPATAAAPPPRVLAVSPAPKPVVPPPAPAPTAPPPEAVRLPPPKAGQVTVARSPIGDGRARFGLQLRGEAKAWRSLKLFGADGKELAFLACDAGHLGPAYTDSVETARLGDPVRVELWAAAASGAREVVETREMPRAQCDGETTFVLWEFD